MGYIPLFLTVGGACFLFFMTVRISLNRKIELDQQLWKKLRELYPDSLVLKSSTNPEQLLEAWKKPNSGEKATPESLDILRQIKVNRLQYNQLIKKAPYNWVAALGGFKPI
ncbi:MAG: hypothetical protein B7Z16_11845 [Algoriphagus sp. 32-45-6]|nr:MAG: hypothetical protein B7Z16_11845 [Algoriphagus sp. 32-45-6]